MKFKVFTANVEGLKEILKIQLSDGNWNYDPYMQGLANGLILSLHTVEDREEEIQFKEKPEEGWLADKPASKFAPIETAEDTITTTDRRIVAFLKLRGKESAERAKDEEWVNRPKEIWTDNGEEEYKEPPVGWMIDRQVPRNGKIRLHKLG